MIFAKRLGPWPQCAGNLYPDPDRPSAFNGIEPPAPIPLEILSMTHQSACSASNVCFAGLSTSSYSFDDWNLKSLLKTVPKMLAWGKGIVAFGSALLLIGAICVPAQAQTLAPAWYQQSPANNP